MFSFIKTLQSLLSNMKKKKGLWFTMLSVLSITGIFLFMYLLTSLTKGVAKDVYVNMSNTYKTSLTSKLKHKEDDFKRIFVSINSNANFRSNLNNVNNINNIMNTYNENYKAAGFNTLEINFYSTVNQINQYRNSVNSVITRKTSSFGIEVVESGASLIGLEPVLRGTDILGVIEIKQPLTALKSEFADNNGIFLFLMEGKMLTSLSIDSRKDQFRDVIEDLKVRESAYDGKFYANIIEAGKEPFKQFKDIGYIVNEEYFKTYKKVSDINGASIGYIILGERVEGSGAFVNIVDNMTKTVTTVALGLVISILLFMF